MRQLPAVPFAFVGREREIVELSNLLTTARVLTLTGTGGAGKTRLALEVAKRIAPEFQDGVTWVDLAPLSDPTLVVNAVASALELREQPDAPLLETITAQLPPKQLLLVLDNCEHLLIACSSLALALVRACPEIQILATSREPLGIAREVVYTVPPLALPNTLSEQAAFDSEAVRLFVQRAVEVMPSFVLMPVTVESVVRVCERLDGLPLGIELAAARVKMLTVSEIAERLDDRFRLLTRTPAATLARHETLRAAMDWSYNLLAADEQILFRRLAIFAGGFTLRAVETVCGDGGEIERKREGEIERKRDGESEREDASLDHSLAPSLILDLLSNLVEKSLVVVAERAEGARTRYRMLETVREYAREKLANDANELNARHARHLHWCIELALRAGPELYGADAARWLTRLDQERDNTRAALRWAITSKEIEAGLRLANAFWNPWEIRANYSEGRRWFEELLAQLENAVKPSVRGRALFCLAAFLYRQGELERATFVAEQSLAVLEQVDDVTASMASTVNLLAVIAADQSNFARALEFYERARVLHLQDGNLLGVSGVLHNLGHAAHMQGDLTRAAHYLEESAVFKRQKGDRGGLAITLNILGEIASDRGQYARAETLFQESLAYYRELGGKMGIANTLNNLGVTAYNQGEYARALLCLNESLQSATEIGSKRDIALAQLNLGDVARAQAQFARALERHEQALAIHQEIGEKEGIALTSNDLAALLLDMGEWQRAALLQSDALKIYREMGNKRSIARALEGSAGLAALRGDSARAAQFLGGAAFLREQAGTPPHLPERSSIERVEQQTRAALGERAFMQAFERGRATPLDETIADALALTDALARTGAREMRVETKPRPALEIFGLGGSVVQREGNTLSMSDWTYAKSKELFFYLLSHPASTKAQIGLDLWADASPAQLRSAFHRTMHFVRKALEHADWITFENDAYRLHGALDYFYDVNAFEQQLAQARQMLRGDSSARARASRTARGYRIISW